MRRLKPILIFLLLITGLMACNDNKQQQQGAEQKQEPKQKTEAQAQEQTQKITTAHYIEEEVERLAEVDHATAVVQNRNAYVAVQLNQAAGVRFNEDLKNKIVGMIRTTDPELNSIHISDNMDYNNRIHGLARDIEHGLPAKAIGDSFEQTIRSVFPELKR